MRLKPLLVCGILAPLLYVATDALAAILWEGYSYTTQTISETFAIGAPTRPLVLARGVAYSCLVMAFGFGVRSAAGDERALRCTGALLIVISAIDLVAVYFTPMHLRGAERTLTDALHIALASVDVLFILLITGFGAFAHGRRFRWYSFATIAVVVVFGTLAGLDGPRLAANEPTPWLGVTERISVFSYMLWLAVLATSLLRSHKGRSTLKSG